MINKTICLDDKITISFQEFEPQVKMKSDVLLHDSEELHRMIALFLREVHSGVIDDDGNLALNSLPDLVAHIFSEGYRSGWNDRQNVSAKFQRRASFCQKVGDGGIPVR